LGDKEKGRNSMGSKLGFGMVALEEDASGVVTTITEEGKE
jgi:hypothetical protein